MPTSGLPGRMEQGAQAIWGEAASFSQADGGWDGWRKGRMLRRVVGDPSLSRSSPPHHRAAAEDDPYCRIKLGLRWYLSGFYKKPKVRGVCGKGRVSAKGFVSTRSGTDSSTAWDKASYRHHGPRSREVEGSPMLVSPCSVFEETAPGYVTSATTHNRVRKGAFDPKLQGTYGFCRGIPLRTPRLGLCW